MSGIKLSEAIRLGATLGPQCKIFLVNGSGGSCAFGSAGLALGVNFEDRADYESLYAVFPSLTHNAELKASVWQKNDHLGWTREQIADWLVESGLDCESVTPAPTKEIAALAEIVAEARHE